MKHKKEFLFFLALIALLIVFMTFKYTGFTVNVPSSVTIVGNETPAPVILPQTPSGGGGGGRGAVLIKNFSLDKELIKVSIKQGENAKEFLAIKNTGNTEIKIILEVSKLERFIILSDEEFVLKAGESKTIGIDLFAKENEAADSYLGKIIVSGEGIRKTVSVILEIKEKRALFDVVTKAQNAFASPGNIVNANIKLINMGDLENVDVLLYYAIKDFNNSLITFREETLAINRELEITRGLELPEDIPLGKYVFYSSITYGGNLIASSSDVFEVITSGQLLMRNLIITFSAILFIIALIILIRFYGARKNEHKLRKSKKRANNI